MNQLGENSKNGVIMVIKEVEKIQKRKMLYKERPSIEDLQLILHQNNIHIFSDLDNKRLFHF